MADEAVREQQREAYSYLMSYKEYDLRIRRLTLQHDELQASLLPQGIRYDQIQVQTSPDNTLEKVAGKVLDMEQRIMQLEEERTACLADIVDTIESLEDDNHKLVLSEFFIARISMDDIAREMHYHRSRIYQIRGEALLAIYEKIRQKNTQPCDIV